MADQQTLKEILGAAYELHQNHRDRAAAIALVRAWIEEDAAHGEAGAEELKRIEALIRARGQRADHISTISADILRGALAG